MLTVYYGSDSKKAEKAYLAGSKSAIKLDPEKLVGAELGEYAKHKSLFEGEQVFAMRGMPIDGAEEFATSKNTFYILTDKLLAPEKKKLEKLGAKIEQFDISATEKLKLDRAKKEEGNKSFRITDALANRDKRALWIEYWRAIYEGVNSEDIFWKLSWQVRAMLTSLRYSSASETDLHPYVYGKARAGSANYSQSELITLSNNLLDIWSESHASGDKGKLALEQFILSA
jgi:hypothetical protein